MSFKYSPIVLDSINHGSFPSVELYVKQDRNYTLYKPQEIKLTIHNIERLKENGTEFIYINTTNAKEVQENIEKNLESILLSKSLPQLSKNLIFSQIIISCIDDVFKNPNIAAAFHKCRTILKTITLEFKDRGEIISLFAKLEEHYEKYLITHTAQVTILSMFIYEKLFNASRDELIEIGVGSMLHDIGMLHIAGDIIEKTDVLSENEYHRVKFHPQYGCDIINNAGMAGRLPLDITLYHHERFDGSGYPKGLSEMRIPRHAMLVSICDIYCALTMNRPYRGASTPSEALKTLKSERRLFDPEIFDGFIGIMAGAPPAETADDKSSVTKEVTRSNNSSDSSSNSNAKALVLEFTKELRAAQGDRNKLLKLHSVVTDSINKSYGEEKEALTAFKTELKDFLNSIYAADKSK